MDEDSIQVLPTWTALAAYGKSIELFRKFRFIPFGYDAVEQKIIVTSSPRTSLLKLKVKKFVQSMLLGINVFVMTLAAIRPILTSDNHDHSALRKLKNVVDAGVFWLVVYAFIIVCRKVDGIPMVLNNLKNLETHSAGGGTKNVKKTGLIRFLESFRGVAVFLGITRAVPIFHNPQRPQYLTSFFDVPENCGAITRGIAGLFHSYAYGQSVAVSLTVIGADLVTCQVLVVRIRDIK